MVVLSCKTVREIISIKRPDTSFFLACLVDIGWFAAMYPISIEKHQLEARTTKMATPPYIIAFNYCIVALRQEISTLAVQGNKYITINMAGPPQNIWMFSITVEHKSSCNTLSKNITNYLFWVLWTYLATFIKSNNPNL